MSGPRGYKVNARYTIHRLGQNGYVVLDPLGRRAGEPVRFWQDAAKQAQELQREADRRRKAGPRPCMCCGHSFESEGVHHRLCGTCRHADTSDNPYAYALPRGRKSA